MPQVFYLCAGCKNEFKATQINVDHVEPLGKTPDFPPVKDSGDWANWLTRLFCGVENLQVLCEECHKTKTANERRKTI